MLDPLFSFLDSDRVENEWLHLIAGETTLVDSLEQFTPEYESMDAALASKVKDIIEKQWGKRVADLQDLSVGRFYERLVEESQVSYRSSNRYVLRAKFRSTQEPRQILFSFTASIS